jgi:hypothetical protein
MPELKLKSIKFGKPGNWHFVAFTSGEHETEIIEDRHDIDVEVMVSSSTKLENVEEIAFSKARTFIKELAESFE